MEIKEVLLKEEKKRITREILEALPDWFGIEESREDYIKKVRSLYSLLRMIMRNL